MISKVKNILFDLGGVILNLDRAASLEAFIKLGFEDVDHVLKDFKQSGTFLKFEEGTIDADAFRDEIRDHIGRYVSDNEIDLAWGKMTSHVEPGLLEFLLILKKDYRTFLLSNTNSIHIDICNPMFNFGSNFGFDSFFERCFYSFELKICKPDPKAFKAVFKAANIKPQETLFVDDSLENLSAAKSLGMLTLHVASPKFVKESFKQLGIC